MSFDSLSTLGASLLAAEKGSLDMGVRLSLSAMSFLEFAIWGAWFVVLGQYLNALKFNAKQIGNIYGTMALGAIFSPIFVASIADRYVNAEIVMAVSHLVGAGLLLWLAQIRTPGQFYWVALVYSLVYSPTISISQAMIFSHAKDAARDFSTIRVLGTVGWIAANLAQKAFLRPGEPVNNRPLLLAALLSIVLGLESFLLPATPPKAAPAAAATQQAPGASTDAPVAAAAVEVPFKKALDLLKEQSFAVFYGVSLFITIALAFYYSFTSLFLEQKVKVDSGNVGPLMTIGQWVEIPFMLTLPWFVDQLGIENVLLLGMVAWGLRYAFFTAGGPFPLIVAGLALHGICYDFFFAAGFIYVDNEAPDDIKNSAQALFGVLTYGLGMYLGNVASGWVNYFTTRESVDPATGQTVKSTNWTLFWLIPCIGVVLSLVVFAAFF